MLSLDNVKYMEVASAALLNGLKHDSLSYTAKEVTRLSEVLRSVYSLALTRQPVDPYVPLVLTHCFLPDVPTPVKKWAYIVLREAAGRLELDWTAVCSTLAQDLHKEAEFFTDALRFLALLPSDDAIRLITSRESDLAACLKPTASVRTAAVVAEALCPLLLQLWEENETSGWRDVARELFRVMLVLTAEERPAWCRMGWQALHHLVRSAGPRPALSDLGSASGAPSDVFDGLLSYALDLLLPNALHLIHRANRLPLQDAIVTVPCLSLILTELQRLSAGAPIHFKDIDCSAQQAREYFNQTLARSLLAAPDPALHLILAVSLQDWNKDLGWILACKLVAAGSSRYFSTVASLRNVAKLIPDFEPDQQILLSLALLERSCVVEELPDKYSLLISGFRGLVRQTWSVFQLLSCPWFVGAWTQPSILREELLACLVTACCYERHNSANWLQTALEAADLGVKMLDWPSLHPSFAADVYFVLLGEVCAQPEDSRVQLLLETLAQRFDGSNDWSYVKCLTIEVLSRHWVPRSEVSFSALLASLQHQLTDIVNLQESAVMTEILVRSCLHLSTRFPLQCSSAIVEWLQDLVNKLDSPKLESVAEYIGKVLTAITRHQLGETAEGQVELSEAGLSGISADYYDALDMAINSQREIICFGQNSSPLAGLRLLNHGKSMHWRCGPAALITGIVDVVLVQASHVLERRQKLLVFVFALTNTTPFELGAIKVAVRLRDTLEPAAGQLRECAIRSLSTGETFTWKVRTRIREIGPTDCSLSIELTEESPDLQQITIKSERYEVPAMDFLCPDQSHMQLEGKFRTIWRRLQHKAVAQCSLQSNLSEVRRELSKEMGEVSLMETQEAYQIGYLSAHLLGDRVAVTLSGLQGSKVARVEVRTSSAASARFYCQQIQAFLPSSLALA
jgi:hypothetical protein